MFIDLGQKLGNTFINSKHICKVFSTKNKDYSGLGIRVIGEDSTIWIETKQSPEDFINNLDRLEHLNKFKIKLEDIVNE